MSLKNSGYLGSPACGSPCPSVMCRSGKESRFLVVSLKVAREVIFCSAMQQTVTCRSVSTAERAVSHIQLSCFVLEDGGWVFFVLFFRGQRTALLSELITVPQMC